MMRVALLSLFALVGAAAEPPPRGWNSWNALQCSVNETSVLRAARAMIDRGLLAAGYDYVVVDDCWAAAARAPDGSLRADAAAFPSGMGALGADLRRMGFRYGLYADAGTRTCAGRAGSLGREREDARAFAGWGVSLLKYDNCNSGGESSRARYGRMRAELPAHIRMAMCNWGCEAPWTWARRVADTWRTGGDLRASWDAVAHAVDTNGRLWKFAGNGKFNDPDMMQLGAGALTRDEERAHFAMWVIMKAPLFISANVSDLPAETVSMLTDAGLLAVHADPLGAQAARVAFGGAPGVQLWVGPLAGGRVVAALLNTLNRSVSAEPPRKEAGAADLETIFPPDAAPILPPHGVRVFVGRAEGPAPMALRLPILRDCPDAPARAAAAVAAWAVALAVTLSVLNFCTRSGEPCHVWPAHHGRVRFGSWARPPRDILFMGPTAA